jgi:hypothetical protein
MIVLMREMFLPRTARFALVVKLASVRCLDGSPWLTECIIAVRQQHKISNRVRKYLYEKSGCNGNLGRVKENMNSLERILSMIRLTETAVPIEKWKRRLPRSL